MLYYVCLSHTHYSLTTSYILSPSSSTLRIYSLLSHLCKNEVIQETQIKMGFERLYEDLPDLSLDCPLAAAAVDSFVEQAKRDGCLEANVEFSRPAAA